MKYLFRKLHLWLSVPFGIIITLTCFSGAMLVFEPEVVKLTHAHLYTVQPPSAGATPLPLDELAARVASTLEGDVRVSGIAVSPDPEAAYRITLSKPKRAAVYVDQYTGEIKGRYERTPFFKAMFSLHRWLLGSRPADGGIFWGKLLVGISTLLFVVILLSGVVIWWPRTKKVLRNSLKIISRQGRFRFWHSLHVAGGMYVFLFVLLMALTGLTWSFAWYRSGVYALVGVEMQASDSAKSDKSTKSRTTRSEKPRTDFAHWQQVFEQIAAENPDYELITLSTNHTATVSRPRLGNARGTDRYAFDPASGTVTDVTRYAQQPREGKIRGWIYSLHVGSWGGWPMRLLYFLAALLAASLPLTGYYLWIRRLRRRRSR